MHNPWLVVEQHSVELPDGSIITDWPWVITPNYTNIVAVTHGGSFLCFRQTKYAVQGVTLALVGGYIEPDESPLAAAKRELLEETGYEAASWQSFGEFSVDGNRGVGIAHLFLAQDAYPSVPIDADDLEEQQLLTLNRLELESALFRGEFKVLSWTTALALALPQLGSHMTRH